MIAFRVDSSSQIGIGHLMRCLTLAGKIQQEKKIVFISRDLEGNANYLIKEKGYELFVLPNKPLKNNLIGYEKWLTVVQAVDAEETQKILDNETVELLVVDHYAIDEKWENLIRPYVQKIMVIDDLANRKHDCDILLDQNNVGNLEQRYRGLVPEPCKLLLGLSYILFREEFYIEKRRIKVRDGQVHNILVSFGGSDATNETMKAIQAIAKLQSRKIRTNVVVGAANPHSKEIEAFCAAHPGFYYLFQVDYMAALMNQADLSIGGGGTATWERCFLELPSVVITIAENQRVDWQGNSPYLDLGWHEKVEVDDIVSQLEEIFRQPQRLVNMSQKSKLIFEQREEKIQWKNIL